MNDQPNDCLPIPRLERINYFYGQMLGVREFQSEQGYFHEKHKLHNRYLHGYGVVCGLEVVLCAQHQDPCAPPVVVAPATAAAAATAPTTPINYCVQIDCGLALTCEGDEVVVRSPVRVELAHDLDDASRAALAAGKPVTVAISICYRAAPIDPVRPIQLDGCTGMVADCVPSRWRDDFCVKVTLVDAKAKPHDCPCSPCVDGCAEPCLVLATVTLDPSKGTTIDNTVRRAIAAVETTRVVSINWGHAGTYTRKDADLLLDTNGITINFSGPVRVETLVAGVIELWGIEGGRGRSGQIFNITGDFVGLPTSGFVTSVTYKRNSNELVQLGDRVMITLRSAMVLDRCCRAVDGEHIGGLAPFVANGAPTPAKQYAPGVCADITHPWRSGNGTPGGSFESWFWIDTKETA